ncbi:MAG TPA: bifunctional DNA primase/polymerase [Methanosarcina sp.]
MKNSPGGYQPYYFPLEKNGKDPLPVISWKKNGKTFSEAYDLMKQGFNIGIAGTDKDNLCIVDVDNLEAVGETKATLTVKSRKQIGRHCFYFTFDPVAKSIFENSSKQNIATEDAGEVRANWQYVVAAGSFVPCSEEEINRISVDDRAYAGKYRLYLESDVSNITFNELPEVYIRVIEEKRERAILAQLKPKIKQFSQYQDKDSKYKSALWNLDIHDVTGKPNNPNHRFPSPFHGSKTFKDTSVSGDLLHCWRHNVSHNAITYLAVESGASTCSRAGFPHGGGNSDVDTEDPETVFTIWKYAKDRGYIPKDDPIPSAAMRYYAKKNGIHDCDNLEDGWKLPVEAYNKALKELEKEGIETGRKPLADKRKAGRQLSERARELLKLAFDKMLACDGDKSQLKNGEGFSKFDSEAVHKDMDENKDVSDEILIKHAYRLKKYKRQLAGFGIDKDELEDVITDCNKKLKASESEKINVFFDEVADRILENEYIFSMRDTAQIYIYTGGVYKSEGAEAILDTHVRDAYNAIYKEKWEEVNPDLALPDHIPKATTRYVNEVIAYIRAYTHTPRKIIDEFQDKYINFKNCLFNLDKWEFEEHNPDIKMICQIPVNYKEGAKCPQITNFLQDVANPKISLSLKNGQDTV